MSKKVTSGFQSAPPKRTEKYEDVINDKNVDAVVIATPHHWHAPIALAAMEAGKDVYIEKPISHVYNEGHAIIKASKKYGRIVQQGSQMRNSAVTLKAEKLLKQGLIGEVKVARAWTAEVRNTVKPVADSVAPSTVNYDRWLGPPLTSTASTGLGECTRIMETAKSVTKGSTIWTWPGGDWVSNLSRCR